MTKKALDVVSVPAEGLAAGQPSRQRIETILDRLFPGPVQRILLVVPPDGDERMFDLDTALRQRYYNHPPYGFGIIAALLRREGYDVDLLNLNLVLLEAARADPLGFDYESAINTPFVQRLDAFSPDLVALTGMYSQSHAALSDTCQRVRTHCPKTPIALGGVHPTSAYEDPLTRQALLSDMAEVDLLFLHEAEYALLDLLRAVNRKGSIEQLGQLVMRDGKDKAIHITPLRRPHGGELDVIPAFDLMSLDRLGQAGRVGAFYALKDRGARFATSQLGRGCRFDCSFCSVRNFNGVGVRGRSVSSVVDELACLVEEHGVDHVVWLDDDFLADEKRAIDLFDGILNRGLKFTWDCSNGIVAASVTEALASGAAASGCIGVYLGVETGSPVLLKEVRKPGRPHHFLRAADILRRHPSIHLRAFLIIGFPSETLGMIQETLDLAQAMDLDWCHVNMFQPLPSTKLFTTVAERDKKSAIDFIDIRFNSGAYGKQSHTGKRQAANFLSDFENAFAGRSMDAHPTRDELADIWTYINFHVNFQRLFRENRPVKIEQNHRYISNIVECVDPNNAFAIYFKAYLSWRQNGNVEAQDITRLNALLAAKPEWVDRFKDFGLALDDLRHLRFPSGFSSGDSPLRQGRSA
jgi:radical SAM superfamily enzyme YgiQ (UPF0313 family)